MTSFKINIPGDEAQLFSLPEDPRNKGIDLKNFPDISKTVFLFPAMGELFGVVSKERSKTLFDPYVNSLCAAIHLCENRGLPLDEFKFVTESGNVTIFYTHHHSYSFFIPKCKQKVTNGSAEISSCRVEWDDCITDTLRIRLFHSSDIDGVSDDTMKILTLAEGKMPDSVVAASEREDGVSLKLYSDYNKNAPSGTNVLFSLLPLFLPHGGQRVIFFDGFRILIKDSGCSKMLLEVFS